MEKPEATPTPTPNLQQATSTLNDDLTGKISTDTEATQTTVSLPNNSSESQESTLIGATLNGDAVIDQRTTYEDGFYYEPLSENLQRYITGVSFPSTTQTEDEKNTNSSTDLGISYDDLSYVHVLHYDFAGNLAEGELICNRAIAQDFVEIFYELYQNEYQIEKMHLIDEYDGDDTASMEDNNTSCFNYRVVAGSTSLSKHALGLAIDINPLYNPYITYEKDETGQITKENVSPVSATAYADREISFPYKIDENDLCYKLFVEHGFTWGGNWNSCKDYQHFQKTVK
ncbi:MAG: M15 family metallopeptidase [Lachnospiraceae bacterium]|nr:M15 family metallopeptidase [Lachnospiraceae bacterium]